MQDRRVKREIWFCATAILSGLAGSARQPVPVGRLIYAILASDYGVICPTSGDLAIRGSPSRMNAPRRSRSREAASFP